ncbi:hypothetical protein IHE44_0002466, partial [Lamprotornis superbus]
ALDSLYFTGFAETNRTFVIARLARRPAGLCEMWLFLRLDGIGEFENSTDVFNFNVDSNPSTFARALAREPWTIELFQRVKKQREQHFRHEQWGQSVGEIEIENYGKTELSLKGIRSHSYGVRNWAEIHRYVMILAHFEDGTAAHLTLINMPATTTHLTVGYVFFPDGRKAGIEWSNASLAELAEDGVIQDEYGVSFTAGGESFDVSAALDKQTCPVVYNGLTGSGVFHECIADFQLNGLTPGWGLVEFYYRDEAAQPLPNLQLGSKTEGPDPATDASPPKANPMKARSVMSCEIQCLSALEYAFLLKAKTQQRHFHHLWGHVLMPHGPPVVHRPQ